MPSFGAAETTLYVAPDGSDDSPGTLEQPLATLDRARLVVRELRQDNRLDGRVTVYLRGGQYEGHPPVIFEPADSGTPEQPVTYKAFPNETPVLSAAQNAYPKWRVEEKGLWSTPVSDRMKPHYTAIINGVARRRARTPLRTVESVPERGDPRDGRRYNFTYAAGDVDPEWDNLDHAEVVLYGVWVDSHLPVESVDPETRTVHVKKGYLYYPVGGVRRYGQRPRFYIENIPAAVDEPGEWFVDPDEGRLYYKPLAGESPTSTTLHSPHYWQHIILAGKPDRLAGGIVHDLRFEGLTFEHAKHLLGPEDANDGQSASTVGAAFTLKGARDIVIRDCTFRHVEGFAIEVGEGSWDNEITGNHIHDTGAGGVHVSGQPLVHLRRTDGDARRGRSPLLRTGRTRITNNHIHDIGRIFHDAAGVLVRHAEDNLIAHNEIHHTFYTGVSLGWVWGYDVSVANYNIVEYTHIHHIGQGMLSDMGAIYTLGPSYGSSLRHNRIHDVESHGYGAWGIYLDEGTTGMLVEKNLVHDTKTGCFNQHFGRENIIRNNVFARCTGDIAVPDGQIGRIRMERHRSFTFERNIVWWEDDAPLFGMNYEDENFHFDHNVYWNPKHNPPPVYATPPYINGPKEVPEGDKAFWEARLKTLRARMAAERKGKVWTWEEWQARGQDMHSLLADPLFVDPDANDFTLRESSPIHKSGFEDFDPGRAGRLRE